MTATAAALSLAWHSVALVPGGCSARGSSRLGVTLWVRPKLANRVHVREWDRSPREGGRWSRGFGGSPALALAGRDAHAGPQVGP